MFKMQDQLFLTKFIKTDVARCLGFSSKCTKMRLAAGLCPDPLWSSHRSSRPFSWIQGVLLLGKGGGMPPILYPDLGDRSPCQ